MATFKRLVKAAGDYVRGFATEDGAHYRREHQELGPAMRRVQLIQEAEERSQRANPMGRHFIGSIPATMLTKWLRERGYTMDQWARNEGGTRCPPGADPVAHATLDGGVKSEFLRWFLSRDNAKLHTQHVTTKRGRATILMPGDANGHHNDVRGAAD